MEVVGNGNSLAGSISTIGNMNHSLLCLTAALLGFLSHILYFIRGRQHSRQAPYIIFFYLFIGVLLTATCVSRRGISGGASLGWLLATCYFSALFMSIVVYRLSFHRTRHFPGPMLARVSKIYGQPWLNRHGKMNLEHERLANEYGDFVRIGPNEIMIRHIEALGAIHGSQSRCCRGMTYENMHFRGELGLASIIDRETHRPRRQVWDMAFSSKALAVYEETAAIPTVRDWMEKLDELYSPIDRTGQTPEIKNVGDKGIDITLFSLLLAFDNMGRAGFSKEFGLVKKGLKNEMLELIEWLFAQIALFGYSFSWPVSIAMALKVDPKASKLETLVSKTTDERMNRSDDPTDMMKFFIQDARLAQPKSLFNHNQLLVTADELFIGATDTIGAALALIFFYLARDKTGLISQLRKELDTLPTPISELRDKDLQNLDLMNAVINETLRMYPPAASAGGRITPSEGLQIGDVWIPGETEVYTPANIYHKCAKYFKRPDEFLPERWTTHPELVIDKRAYNPFSMGHMNCVGRRLALTLMRHVLANTIWNYNFSFAPGEDGTSIESEMRDHIILKPGPLYLSFSKVR